MNFEIMGMEERMNTKIMEINHLLYWQIDLSCLFLLGALKVSEKLFVMKKNARNFDSKERRYVLHLLEQLSMLSNPGGLVGNLAGPCISMLHFYFEATTHTKPDRGWFSDKGAT